MRLLVALVALLAFAPAAEASLLESSPGEIRPGHLVVSGPRLDQDLSNKDMQSADTSLREEIVENKVWLVRVDPGVPLSEARADLLQQGGVQTVEFDTRVEATNLPPLTDPVPNDGMWSNMWGLQNTGQSVNGTAGTSGSDIKARYAWQLEKGTAGDVVVGVADTGIDLQHGDLDGKIWTNPDEIAGNGIDDDGNNYIDDTRGWNWVSSTSNPDDDQYHGTHVAGTIAAETNNAYAVTGISWGARLAPLKVLDSGGSGWTSDIMAAADYAGKEGMEVFNASLGGGSFSSAFLAVLQAHPNTLYVFAAGNNGQNINTSKYYPCSYNVSNVLCVGASTQSDGLASFSNYGSSEVDLVAPGVNILSTYPRNSLGEDRVAYLNGTSMATPHVAGVAALIRQYRSNGTGAAYASILRDTVDTFSAFSSTTISGGRLNAYKALLETAARNPGEDPPDVQITSGTPAWVNTRSPSWQFSVLRGVGSPQCSLDAVNPEGGSDWSGACATASSHSASNLVEGEAYVFQVSASNNLGTDVATHSFRVDTIAPVAPSITSSPPLWHPSASATWGISGETEASFSCNIGAGWVPCSGTPSGGQTTHQASSIADGAYTFQVRQTDRAGNVSPVSSRSFNIDTTPPPAPTVTSKPAEWTSSTSASVAFEGSSPRCSWNGAAYESCSSPFVRSGLQDGAYTLRITQSDQAGNVSPVTTVSWNVDSTAPALPTITGPSGTTAFRNVTFSLASEVGATLFCSLDNTTLGDCSGSMSYENLSLGSHTFRFRQVDRAGNSSSVGTRTFSVSDSGTELVWNSLPPSVTNSRSPRFSWTLSDPSYQVRCALSSTIFRACSGSNEDQMVSLVDGSYIFRARVEDGNGSWFVRSHEFVVDGTAPEITISGPSGIQTSRGATITWAASEGGAWSCFLDNQPTTPCQSPRTLSGLGDGEHTFRVQLQDAAGNIASASRSWSVDATPPAAPALAVVSGKSTSAEVTISTEVGASSECRLNSGAWNPCASPWRGNLSEGSHRLDVRSRDQAGNVSETATVSWQVGADALPSPSLRGPLADGTVVLEGATGTMEYMCAFAGEQMRVCPGVVSLRLTNGTYPYRLQIREGSRLSAETQGTITVSGSPAPPQGPVGVSVNSGQEYTNKAQVDVRLVWPAGTRSVILASDGSFNGQTFAPAENTGWTLPVSGAERLPKTVYARFLGAGGEILYSGSDDIILDTSPPVIRKASAQERGRKARKVFELSLEAADGNSGIHLVQIRKSSVRPGPNQNGEQRKIGKDLSLQGRGAAPHWTRVRDRAGNWSVWKPVQ